MAFFPSLVCVSILFSCRVLALSNAQPDLWSTNPDLTDGQLMAFSELPTADLLGNTESSGPGDDSLFFNMNGQDPGADPLLFNTEGQNPGEDDSLFFNTASSDLLTTSPLLFSASASASDSGDDACQPQLNKKLKSREPGNCINPALSNQESDPSLPSSKTPATELESVKVAAEYWCVAANLKPRFKIPVCDLYNPDEIPMIGNVPSLQNYLRGPGFHKTVTPARRLTFETLLSCVEKYIYCCADFVLEAGRTDGIGTGFKCQSIL